MSKKVIIMHGIPGSGKSTKAKELVKCLGMDEITAICSADDYHMVNGEYVFKPKNIRKAHDTCKSKFVKALKDGVPLVIVDNTNICEEEWFFYDCVGREFGYEIGHDVFKAVTPEDVLRFGCRNTHGVPISVCFQMWERWEDPE